VIMINNFNHVWYLQVSLSKSLCLVLVCAHQASLLPSTLYWSVYLYVPSWKSERPCVCVQRMPFFYWILEMFRQCGIYVFVFHFDTCYIIQRYIFFAMHNYTSSCMTYKNKRHFIWAMDMFTCTLHLSNMST